MKPIFEVEHVVKRYRLGQTHGLRQTLARAFRSKNASAQQPPNTFNALDGVDFKVEPGEVLGIIGTNGAGKSTLLKVLAGITKPTSGRMLARGRVAPLIEVGAGLIADLTGRENVYLNGVILGMSVKEIKRKFDDIVGFAELDKFIDTPIKRYSSGMAIRLGFAIATAVESEILIVDEVLAVGDVAFQRKCFDRIENIIKNQGKTILLVSHNIRQVERLCTRAILLDRGRILVDGDARDVSKQFYERTNAKMRADATATSKAQATSGQQHPWSTVELLGLQVLDRQGRPTDTVPFKEDVTVEVTFRARQNLRKVLFSVGVHTSDMLYLATHDSDVELKLDTVTKGDYKIRCHFKRLPLVPGVYSLRLGIMEAGGTHQAYYGENLLHFQISTAGASELAPASPHGFFALEGQWRDLEPLRDTVAADMTLEAA